MIGRSRSTCDTIGNAAYPTTRRWSARSNDWPTSSFRHRRVHRLIARDGRQVSAGPSALRLELGLEAPIRRFRCQARRRDKGVASGSRLVKNDVLTCDLFMIDLEDVRLGGLTWVTNTPELHAAGSLTGADVRRIVARVVGRRGSPTRIRSDNGSEFICEALTSWWKEVGCEPIPVEAGSPWQNGFIESFHSRLRRVWSEWSSRAWRDAWRRRPGSVAQRIRPHSSIDYKTPREFSEECDRKNSIKDGINCGVEDAGIR